MKSGMAKHSERAESRTGILVVVPCGRRKVWDKRPDYGPALARDAYISPTFALNRAYAERFGDQWVILSAKYGFIDPDVTIPEPYNVTFKNRATHPISVDRLQQQVHEQGLGCYETVIGLGFRSYREIIEASFAGLRAELCFPFSGLPIGKYMQAVKRALDSGDPGSQRRTEKNLAGR